MFAVNFSFFPEQASTVASQVDSLFFFLLAISVFFSLLIAGILFYFAIRYRRKYDDQVGKSIHGSTALELGMMVLPFLITMGTFVWGAKVFFTLSRPPADAVEYYVTAKQWMWKIQHPQGQREINNLHIPVGVPVKLTMTSEDVIHSFFVPAFRVKMDVVPGRYTTIWFEPTKTGEYHLFCAEYCGTEHAFMGGSVIVMQPDDYEDWLAGSYGSVRVTGGEALFKKHSCNTCHRDNSSARAPILAGVIGSKVHLQDGETLIADENYLRESIMDPRARVVRGYQPIMPTFKGQMSEEDVLELVQYIRDMNSE